MSTSEDPDHHKHSPGPHYRSWVMPIATPSLAVSGSSLVRGRFACVLLVGLQVVIEPYKICKTPLKLVSWDVVLKMLWGWLFVVPLLVRSINAIQDIQPPFPRIMKSKRSTYVLRCSSPPWPSYPPYFPGSVGRTVLLTAHKALHTEPCSIFFSKAAEISVVGLQVCASAAAQSSYTRNSHQYWSRLYQGFRKDIFCECHRLGTGTAVSFMSSSLPKQPTLTQWSEDVVPTIAFNYRKVRKNAVTLKIWDVAGQPKFRSMWERYCNGVDAVVYVLH